MEYSDLHTYAEKNMVNYMRYLLCFLLCLPVFGFAQSTDYSISGVVMDKESGAPIYKALVTLTESKVYAYTNSEGRFELSFKRTGDPVSILHLQVRHTGFITGFFEMKYSESPYQFTLDPFVYEAKGVVISAEAKPDSVWGSKSRNVGDFAFVKDGMLLLTYEAEERWKRQEDAKRTLYNGAQVIWVDANGIEQFKVNVPGLAERFHLDHLDDVILITRDSTFFVSIQPTRLELVGLEQSVYKDQVLPVKDTLNDHLLYSTHNPDYPAFEYRRLDKKNDVQWNIRSVEDEQLMELFRSEWKYLDGPQKAAALRLEQRTGIEKEILAAYMRGFQNTLYYESIYAPLMVMNDTIYIFDHTKDLMVRLDKGGQPLDSAFIDYHQPKRPEKWGEEVVMDKAQREVYTYTYRQGKVWVKWIDKHHGKVRGEQSLYWKFIDYIRVRDGWVYYIYRPFESSQNRYLYRELLRVN